jgi:hypothetical protein
MSGFWFAWRSTLKSTANSTRSTLRERIVEHLFIGEALRALWRQQITDVEVLRAEFDAHGYDLVLCRGAIVRHIQFKTQAEGDVSVSLSLAEKPSGCVIWVVVDDQLNLTSFRWFGGLPGEPLPDISALRVARRATANKQGEKPKRKNHRLVPKRYFEAVDSLEVLLERLIGDLVP